MTALSRFGQGGLTFMRSGHHRTCPGPAAGPDPPTRSRRTMRQRMSTMAPAPARVRDAGTAAPAQAALRVRL